MVKPDDIIVNTQFEYYDHMIIKVWDSYIQQKGLRYFYQTDKGTTEENVSTLFTGQNEMLFSRIAGIILDGENLYINTKGQSVSICGAVDYLNNLEQAQHNAITGTIEIALMQIQKWNRIHINNKIKHHVIVFPNHANANHWNLGVVEHKFDINCVLKECQLTVKEPLYKQNEISEEVIKTLRRVIPVEIRSNVDATEQQNDSTSCGVISAENGKDIIDGSENRLALSYTIGARDLRLKHINEVKNKRFIQIQQTDERYTNPQIKFNASWENIKQAFEELVKRIKDKPNEIAVYNQLIEFFQNANNQADPYKDFQAIKHRILSALKNDLVSIEVSSSLSLFSLLFKNNEFDYQDNAIDTLHKYANQVKEQPKVKQELNLNIVKPKIEEKIKTTQEPTSMQGTDLEELFSEEEKVEKGQRSLKELNYLLRKKYQENPYIERLFYPDNPLSLEQCYLHLALIEEKEIKKAKEVEEAVEQGMPNKQNKSKEEYTVQREHFLREYERIEHIERKLDLKDLLAECKQTPKRIYIEGAAGAGKTTLSRYIVHQWSLNQEPWKQYRWVFHIHLRELTENNYTEKNTELLKVFERECFGLGHGTYFKKEEKESLEKAMRQNPNQILLVLDGADELQLTTNYVREIWQSLINSNYDLLFTSRPGAHLIKRDLRINRNLGVLGFSDEQLEKYIKNFFDPNNTPNIKAEDANNCLNVLKNNTNLWSLAHTPIQLELICSIWGSELKQQDLNLTNLYRLMLDKLFKRNKQLILKKQGKEVSINDIDEKPLKKEYQKYLRYMEYLAFLGMSKKSIILQTPEINEAYKIVSSKTEDSLYFYEQLKALGILKRYDNGNKAEYAHLTFQEFFAAKYMARAIKAFCEEKVEGLSHEALIQFIGKTKCDPFYEVMWWFVAGLLAGKTNQYLMLERYNVQFYENIHIKLPKSHMRLQRLQGFFDLLLQEPRNALRCDELLLLSRCLDEARMPEIMQKEAIVNHTFYYYTHVIINDEYFKFKSLSNKSRSLIKLNPLLVKSNRVLFEGFLLKIIFLEGTRERIRELNDLIKLIPETAIPLLLEALKNKNVKVKFIAAEALGEVGTHAVKLVIPALLVALTDKERYSSRVSDRRPPPRPGGGMCVCRAAAEALSNIGTHALGVVIPTLLEALKDQNEHVRRAAAEALGRVGIPAAHQVIPSLLEGLTDNEIDVRIAAAEALGKVGAQAAEQVIPALLEALKDQNEHVRRAAAEALGKVGAQAAEQVIPALLEALNDQYEEVRFYAADFLVNIGTQAAEKVIPGLLKALKGQDGDVREFTALVLKSVNVGIKSAEQVIPALQDALKDKEWDVRTAVAEVLGNVGTYAVEVVIPRLLEALKDQNEHVRIAAAEALGKVGIPAAEQVISALLEALKNQHVDVRIAAAEALGKVGIPAAERVIPALLELLKDKESYVREGAVRALCKINSLTSAKVNYYLEQTLNNSFMPQDKAEIEIIIILLLKNIHNISPIFLAFCLNKLFPGQPPSVPPSCIINSFNDIVKVDDKGKLSTLSLCGAVMESMIKNNQESHVITQDYWTISIVRKREGARNDNVSPGFFKSIKFTNGLFDHAFIIIEGIDQNVRFANKIDLYAEQNKTSQSSGQRIRIEITDIRNDFKRLEKLAENCSCMVQGISRQKAEQLKQIIERDQAAAERAEIIYNIKGDGNFSNSNRDKKEHSCISWCLEKWQEIELPLQRKWYDAIVVVPKAYLPEPEFQEKCLII